ncbi:MAG: ATP-dependent RNA helicase HrpA [Spirochaetales bacterium]|nr:ATP-dependent RNA helicase HrpA [Spirochaetales bacterium]
MKEIHYPQNLPITEKRKEIVSLIQNNQVIVLSGETGSGKTTQIPKFCLEAGLGGKGKQIACTQPRRLAAVSVASRIAEELHSDLGGLVGYKIRFDEKTGPKTKVKLMTDGVLLAETQSDKLLSHYDCIIVDEAHERSLNIDFLLGILRLLIKKRKDLKIIITSATIDTKKFSEAFDNAPIIEVSGRTYPVELRYRPPSEEEAEKSLAESGADALEEILLETTGGDVLIFMPTEQDIVECCELIETRYNRWQLNVLPLYARLSSGEQHRIFEASTRRKIVVSTNVAETSLTIPGIVYVIDTGVARIARYTPSTGTFGLPVESVSRSSADQRKGRCGRIQEGICIRLYSEEDYNGRTLYTPPEVLRTNLAEVILRMLSLKIYDIENFPFVDPPQSAGIRDGYKTLEELRAIREVDNRERKNNPKVPKKIKLLTKEGYRMAQLPMDPRLAKMILQAGREGCVDEALVLAGALSIHDPRERPSEKAGSADQKHARFRHEDSDFITFLNLWKGWLAIGEGQMKLGALKKYCKENYLSFKRMREWRDLYRQFRSILKEDKAFTDNQFAPFKGNEEALYSGIHKAVLSGFLSHISHKKDKNIYEATRKRETMIFPGSGLFGNGGEWLVSAEMVRTNRLYMRVNAKVEAKWISQIGAHLVKKKYITPWWEDRKGEVLCKEEEKIFGFLLNKDKTVPYGQYMPREAAEMFIREGLCGDASLKDREPDFLKANRKLVKDLSTMEDKLRRKDLIKDGPLLEDFYTQVINRLSGSLDKPMVIYDVRQLNRLITLTGDKELYLKEEDLLASDSYEYNAQNYPDYFVQDDRQYRFEYKYNPGEADDGVTLRIPKSRLGELDKSAISPTVPGRNRELVTALLKGLAKEKRKQLIPINAHVEEILKELDPHSSSPVSDQIIPIIYKKWQLVIHQTDWNEEKIPEYLKVRFALEDKRGKIIKAARDKSILYEKFEEPQVPEKNLKKVKSDWERHALKDWKGLNLPESIKEKSRGQRVTLFPVLKKAGKDVDIRLERDRDEARRIHREGTATLFRRYYFKEEKNFRKSLALKESFPREVMYLGGADQLEDQLWERVFLDLFGVDNCRKEEQFNKLREQQAGNIFDRGESYGENLNRVLFVYSQCRQMLMKSRSREKKGREQFLADREADLNLLMPDNFLLVYEAEHWSDLVRYIKTLYQRIERGMNDPLTDSKRNDEWHSYFDIYEKMMADLSPHATKAKRDVLDELFWLLQEYRVALFGGGVVKTARKVSPKKLDEKISEARSLV